MKKDFFPAFVDKPMSLSIGSPSEEFEISTKEVKERGQLVLKAVVSVVDHVKELAGLKVSDFDISTLIATDQLKNLQPAVKIALDPLAQYDVLETQSSLLMSQADVEILQSRLAASESISSSSPSVEPSKTE